MRILLVDGQIDRAESWHTFFQSEGLAVERAATGEDAMDLLRHYPFDLALIDLALRDMDGTILISRMRRAGHHTPAVALTITSSAKQRLAALSAGADDVLGQDADRAEILARMRAVFRRYRGFSQSVIRCGNVTLHQERQDVTCEGKHVHFTKKEFALLQLLMMRKNTVMTKEVIFSNLYSGTDEPEIKIIDVFICKIRNKLAKAGQPNLIQTVWGRGYMVREDGRDENDTPEPRLPIQIQRGWRETAFA